MQNPAEDPFIRIKGAREHNLRDLTLAIPRGRLVVVTGVSGSGKSSLAFDTIYAEGYRKFIDSLSARARSLLDQVRRPDVDYIEGLPPVIAVEQRSLGFANPRSTVATATEVADYARVLWSVAGEAHCPLDGGRVVRRSLDDCVDALLALPEGTRITLLAPVLEAKPAIVREELPRLRQRGFQRVRIAGEIRLLEEIPHTEPRGTQPVALDLVVDRVVADQGQRSRIADSLELAFREGGDRAVAWVQEPGADAGRELPLSQKLACERCGRVHEPLTPAFFSHNSPDGACPGCRGVGETRRFAPELLVPDASKSVREGAIKPWRFGSKRMIVQHNAILKQLAEQLPFDADAPWSGLPAEMRDAILHGCGERLFSFRMGRGKAAPAEPFAGVIALLDRIFAETSSEGLRARLMAFQVAGPCPACRGARLSAASLAVKLGGAGIGEFLALPVSEALGFVARLEGDPAARLASDCLAGLRLRLGFLEEVGLGYLSLDRACSTLSGGEAQRVRLATQLGMGLVGVAYVLDEPSIGLHAFDNRRLIATLQRLRDRGNTVIVVEHDEDTMRAADQILELGPGAGPEGGALIFQGTPAEAEADGRSISGAYLSGHERLWRRVPVREPGPARIVVEGARAHNLRNVRAEFPAGLLTCVTGVSGSGKSTLVNDILAAAAAFRLNGAKAIPLAHDRILGLERFSRCVVVDQSPIGQSARSNPATFTKIFDPLRAIYAQCPLARVRGYGASRFSFNLTGGRCERCQGAGSILLDMQFLDDVAVTCPSCGGKRYNRETLEVRFKGLSIAEALGLSVSEALGVFRNQPRMAGRLQTLEDVGLGYLRLGQPANTLSGGEAQRLKLSLELGKSVHAETLYLLDEPTTGLHWVDIQRLLDVLFRLREQGHTLVVIEHNLDVVRLADWVIDMGPGGGAAGGEIVYAGPPDGLVREPRSITGQCMKR